MEFVDSSPAFQNPSVEFDSRVRLTIYEEIIRTGAMPRLDSLAGKLKASVKEVHSSCERLYAAHTGIVPLAEGGELLFAAPFCAVPTPFQVEAQGRSWFAPCGWDAFGVVVVLGGTGIIRTRCACCEEGIIVRVENHVLQDRDGWMNLVVPAKRFWEDIVFT